MGWQDRDYAREPTYRSMYARGSGSWTGSIVNVLLAVNIGIFLLCLLTGGASSPLYSIGQMRTDLVVRGQIWRLITSQYLHDPGLIFHIAFNMLTLHFLGRPLEARWGNRKFFTIYTAAGVVASLCLVAGGVFFPDRFPPSWPAVGASGCILGLVGVSAVLFPNAMVILLVFPMTMRVAALLLTSVYVLNILAQGWNYGGDLCHLGGLAFGVLWAKYGETGRVRLPAWLRWESQPRRPGRAQRSSRGRSGHVPPDSGEIDRILAKIHEHGIGSLSESEKRTLKQASERERELDERYGRVDRL